ncbi:hypothetical protein ABZW03_35685 [Kitasatospora sp. NPDC004799]|uniref:hypothetical protein n=1 Tax=Kitasatospora sp. NPDC004799 TaxID=3154460 RepID=UPI0033A94646
MSFGLPAVTVITPVIGTPGVVDRLSFMNSFFPTTRVPVSTASRWRPSGDSVSVKV